MAGSIQESGLNTTIEYEMECSLDGKNYGKLHKKGHEYFIELETGDVPLRDGDILYRHMKYSKDATRILRKATHTVDIDRPYGKIRSRLAIVGSGQIVDDERIESDADNVYRILSDAHSKVKKRVFKKLAEELMDE